MLKQFPLVRRNPSQWEATKMQRSGLFREAVNLQHLGGKHFGILIALYHLNFHRCVAQSYALWHHDLHLELQLTHSMLMCVMLIDASCRSARHMLSGRYLSNASSKAVSEVDRGWCFKLQASPSCLTCSGHK